MGVALCNVLAFLSVTICAFFLTLREGFLKTPAAETACLRGAVAAAAAPCVGANFAMWWMLSGALLCFIIALVKLVCRGESSEVRYERGSVELGIGKQIGKERLVVNNVDTPDHYVAQTIEA